MAKGPSPIIPLLMVVALGLLLHGNSFTIMSLNLPLASEAENAVFMCIVFLPLLAIMAVYSATHTIVLPILIVLAVYTVTTMLLGPLMLILILYVAGSWLSSIKCNGEELGWVSVIVIFFFLLQWVLSGDGMQSGALVVAAVMVFLYYHFIS